VGEQVVNSVRSLPKLTAVPMMTAMSLLMKSAQMQGKTLHPVEFVILLMPKLNAAMIKTALILACPFVIFPQTHVAVMFHCVK